MPGGRSRKPTSDELLGAGGGAEYVGPRAPRLPPVTRSMDARQFTLAALDMEGARVAEKDGIYSVEGNDLSEHTAVSVAT